MKFSEKIIQARKAKALTQEDLAEAVGVSRQAVSKWETGEAKPDLEKLMGVCKVLDLSMDYLCLDKEPMASTQQDSQNVPVKVGVKRYLLTGLCIGLVTAILIGLVVMGLIGKNWVFEPSGPASADSNYADMMSKIEVSDAKCELVGNRMLRVSFVPSIQVPGMQVQIAVRNNKTGSTYYKDATKSGASYVIDYPMPEYEYDYDFIAVCRIGEVSVQFSLVNAESDDGIIFRWKYLWKEQ